VLHGGETWVSTTVLNVAEPGVFGWETRQQELAALRRRGRNGQFVGDDPTTPGIDEAWLSGESPVA
jgi:hypothetical protein